LECKFTDLIYLRWPDVLKSGGKFPSLQESSPPPNPLSTRKETKKNETNDKFRDRDKQTIIITSLISALNCLQQQEEVNTTSCRLSARRRVVSPSPFPSIL
jgi:hypothetical protein